MNEKIFSGLSIKEVENRKSAGKINNSPKSISKSYYEIFKDNVLTLFNLYNVLIGICLFLVNAYTNMAYLAVIFLNVTIGIISEVKAKKQVENLALLNTPSAKVVRDKEMILISSEEIVVDDIIILEAGKQIPSDSVIIFGEIEVNESLLTGESDLILKKENQELLSGSFVVSGKCYARVKNVGIDNFATKIAEGARKHQKVNSNILNSMRFVTKCTSFLIIPIGLILFCEAFLLRDVGINDSVITSAAAILGMLPKGLVLLISISLAAGVINLGRKNILVQEMYAIESLAHVDVLCLDKTGTITKGEIKVVDFQENKNTSMPFKASKAMEYFIGAAFDNNSTFLALKEFFSFDESLDIIGRVPFTSERKWSSISFKEGTIILGAPEKLLENNTASLSFDIGNYAESSQRILLGGYTKKILTQTELPDLEIFAVIVMADELRENVNDTLKLFKDEGVEVKIISGDNPKMVSSIACQAGLEGYEKYIDMSKITTENLDNIVSEYKIFGRVTPILKKEIILALKKNHTVAMVGDGVNDVLALREADCGIAVHSGSEVAKQVSKIVLLENNFESISEILFEGRRVVNNISKVAGIFFIKTIYSVFLSFILICLNAPFPFIPIQITLIDLAIEGYPSLFLSLQRNKDRIKDKFLNSALTSALPYAILVTIYITILLLIREKLAIPEKEIFATMFLVMGFISVLQVLEAARPFDKYRIFFASSSGIGFFIAVVLFKDILHLTLPAFENLWLFSLMSLSAIPLCFLLDRMIKKINVKLKEKNIE